MNFLLYSIIALALGPVLYQIVKKLDFLLRLIDGFVFVSISGLLLFHFIPHLYEEPSLTLPLLILAGFLGPNILEKTLHSEHTRIHKLSLFFAVFGILLHTLFDGAALSLLVSKEAHNLNIATAVILHRLPVGLTIWWLIIPTYGKKIASSLILTMITFTCFGFFIMNDFIHSMEHELIHAIEAFVAGTLLHVVFFRMHLSPQSKKNSCCNHNEEQKLHSTDENHQHEHKFRLAPAPEALGNLCALLLLFFLTNNSHNHIHASDHSALFLETFLGLAYQTAPALLAAYLLAGIIQSFLPKAGFSWLKKGGNFTQMTKGVVFGLPLPICSCGVLPLYKSLVDKKIPHYATLAFLIATPEIGVDAILISLPLLGFDITIIRLASAALLAFLVSFILAKTLPKAVAQNSLNTLDDEQKTVSIKLKNALNYGLIKLVDSTSPWIVLGLLIAAIVEPFIEYIPFNLPYGLDVILFSFIGIFTYICATGATPFVAILIASGMSPGAGIALLLTGPATNISTFGVISSLHSKKFATLFAVTTFVLAVLIGISINLIFTDININSKLISNLHAHANLFQEISLWIVSLLFFYSIYRKGARSFLSEIF